MTSSQPEPWPFASRLQLQPADFRAYVLAPYSLEEIR
jgi:hypothetical protein